MHPFPGSALISINILLSCRFSTSRCGTLSANLIDNLAIATACKIAFENLVVSKGERQIPDNLMREFRWQLAASNIP